MISIPVQCTQEIPACLHEKSQPLTATAHNSAAQCGIGRLSRNVGTFSDLLAEDMSRLYVDVPCQRKEDGNLEQTVAPLKSLDPSRLQGASSSVSKNPGRAGHLSGDRTMHTVRVGVFTFQGFSNLSSDFTVFFLNISTSCPLCLCQMPATDGPSQVMDCLSESDGMLMSDVALQSHVCEFCQAVFPGDSTTRGEFLRHLYTHVN